MFPTNKVAENVFATAGSIIWSVVVIPQIVKSYRTKSTHGLSPWLMLLWAGSAFTYGPYAFTQHLSIAFCVQAQLFYLFTCISFSQCLYYSSGYSVIKSISVLFALLLLFAGFETGSIFALRRADSEGLPGVAMAYAYMTNAFNVLGLLPQYYEIFRLREVVGISLIFLALDVSGGVLSFLSLFFRPKLDVPAFVSEN
ncbi:hypothetical protein TREMEDRAFT_62544 [Tremella mesenterica DSM 1558]|uniref:uncharacterized protein n=1 Tax=Tremella mesenterica (strain ATCC 24925 / CBS 8224 / DSM 1558 / NBRC 9311 / NRRL Y-6157 / RJB 2259-6 / UBC 559-6) TaxID=578456 RepID=UPI0003F48CEE|nr:uncharacterized protein TREMEDRAFT_62544 [Tremella mesenterica DSM 1558]EIW69675.1 hypothetical protein TREMEDRAFT_62544 [Tremella mesenterica DSM 1558]